MTQCQQFVKIIKEWRERQTKTITNVLQRIAAIGHFKNDQLEMITQSVITFHKEIGKEEELAENDWFPLCISLKKKLQKLVATQQKSQQKIPLEKKASQQNECPSSLLSGRGPTDQTYLKVLYKSFLTNYNEASSKPETVPFLSKLFSKIKELFEDKMETQMNKRLNNICQHLAREGSKQSKGLMLEGKITPDEVSKDDQDIYLDQETKDRLIQKQKQQFEASQTGFYDQMKKEINKNASEECRFCRKKNAYCEDMKQIRAADQPMTRFMRCNTCGKAWRD